MITVPSEIRKIAVIGLGYVGLPLAVHLARANYSVVGVDIDPLLVKAINTGSRPTRDLPKEVFPIPDTMSAVMKTPKEQDAYIICVPTPDTAAHGNVGMDPTFVRNACMDIGAVIPDGAVVIIESTVTPSTTMGMFRECVASAKGDYNFHMAFSPERVNPGSQYFYEMGNTEKLVGAEPECQDVISTMYSRIFEDVVIIGVEEAELAKTFENAQRDLNIALMNELAHKCFKKRIDYTEVLRGLRTKSTSPKFTSGMVGGHCIPVDPYFLAEYYGDDNCLAMHGRRTNENYILKVARAAIDCNKKSDGLILIIGSTYKAGVVDQRNSGGIKLRDTLSRLGATVEIHDPLLATPRVGDTPSVIVGAINHHPNMDVYSVYNAGPQTKFINIGEAFTPKQTSAFAKTIQL